MTLSHRSFADEEAMIGFACKVVMTVARDRLSNTLRKIFAAKSPHAYDRSRLVHSKGSKEDREGAGWDHDHYYRTHASTEDV